MPPPKVAPCTEAPAALPLLEGHLLIRVQIHEPGFLFTPACQAKRFESRDRS